MPNKWPLNSGFKGLISMSIYSPKKEDGKKSDKRNKKKN